MNQPVFIYSKSAMKTSEQCAICLRLTVKTLSKRQLHCFNVFIISFEQIPHILLEFLLLILNNKLSVRYDSTLIHDVKHCGNLINKERKKNPTKSKVDFKRYLQKRRSNSQMGIKKMVLGQLPPRKVALPSVRVTVRIRIRFSFRVGEQFPRRQLSYNLLVRCPDNCSLGKLPPG